MLKPPFKLAMPSALTDLGGGERGPSRTAACCEHGAPDETAAAPARRRLGDLDSNLLCSVIGTCLSTGELRKLMARFLFVRDASDLEVHHEAVQCAVQGGPVVKALQKALDHRHDAVLQRFARVHEVAALRGLWDEALQHGEVPGAYWAVLTHRHTTVELRQQAFGDVHMLSHLVGAANRADIRRLVALERENEALRDRGERQQARAQALADARDRTIADLQAGLANARADADAARTLLEARTSVQTADELAAALTMVALQTERRERAELAASVAEDEAARLKLELAHLASHVQTLNREVAAAETQLREIGDAPGATGRALSRELAGRRIFYVGGRPSSTPSIRDLVLRHGGEFQHHDGGLEDRKGLLAAGVAWAQRVVFPVDCVDHDSAGNLKRLCARHGVAYLPLRSASVASFAAALAGAADDDAGRRPGMGCRKHG